MSSPSNPSTRKSRLTRGSKSNSAKLIQRIAELEELVRRLSERLDGLEKEKEANKNPWTNPVWPDSDKAPWSPPFAPMPIEPVYPPGIHPTWRTANNCTSCGCKQREAIASYHRRKSLIGCVYGRLIVKEEYFKDKQRRCVCQCSCGETKDIEASNLLSKNTVSCGCAWDDFLNAKIKYKSIEDRHSVFRPMINNSSGIAKSKKMDFDLDLEYLFGLWESQDGTCPYTGVKMQIPQWKEPKKKNYTNASIDRIDSSKGYVKGNVQFVSIIANYAKNTSSHEEMVKFCKSIALFWKDKI